MKKLTLLAIILFSPHIFAAMLKSEEDAKNLCHKSATEFSRGEINKSFDTVKPYWPIPVDEITNLSYQTKSQLDRIKDRFGRVLSAEFIETQKAGSSFLKYSYAIKFEKHAVRYTCIFYKPKNDWVVNTVSWDDSIHLLFH